VVFAGFLRVPVEFCSWKGLAGSGTGWKDGEVLLAEEACARRPDSRGTSMLQRGRWQHKAEHF